MKLPDLRHFTPFLLLACSACGSASTSSQRVELTANEVAADVGAPSQAALPRFDPVKIDAMKKRLLSEPKIKDVLFTPDPLSVEWQVGVADDGSSRVGYAGYVCTLLSEQGLVDKDTDVRVVDIARIGNGDFRGASLGHVSCSTQQDLGV